MVESRLFAFKDKNLLDQALTHKSYYNENKYDRAKGHNERLEFLGDAVLDFFISTELMKTFSDSSEGELSRWRASLVNKFILADIAKDLKLSSKIYLGKGETTAGIETSPRILSSVFEALIGAFYLEKGFDMTYEVLKELFQPYIDNLDTKIYFQLDYKTRLQEFCQMKFKCFPKYKVTSEKGPSHSKTFIIHIILNKEVCAQEKVLAKNKPLKKQLRKLLGYWGLRNEMWFCWDLRSS